MTDKGNILKDSKYLGMLYSQQRRPETDYPKLFSELLRDKYYQKSGSIVDIGCGRGDMLKAFHGAGFNVSGVDLSPASAEFCKPHKVEVCDLENDILPFDDEQFDCVFSKSVIEHLHNPMPLLLEAQRVLAVEGTAVIMTPSWLHTAWGPFYLDYTHVTPFTAPSLRDAMMMAGFEDVKVYHFQQLPFLWRYPWLTPLIRCVAKLPLRYSPMYDINLPPSINKFFRFSKEVMLLGVGRKK